MQRSWHGAIITGLLAWLAFACGDGDGGQGPNTGLPPGFGPVLVSLSPDTLYLGDIGADSVVLTATGHRFRQTSVVVWDSTAMPTTYISPSHLQTTLPGSDILRPDTTTVVVHTPGVGESAPVPLPIDWRIPVITSVTPPSFELGGPTSVLEVRGTDFGPWGVIYWDGEARQTTRDSLGTLSTTFQAGDLYRLGMHSVSVRPTAHTIRESAPVPFAIRLNDAITSFDSVSLQAWSVVNDSTRNLLYASASAADGQYPNRVVVIDPVSAAVLTSIPVGNEPSPLAISDNGQFLYVGLRGASSIVRVDLATRTVDRTIQLGSHWNRGPFFAEDIVVVPGAPTRIAVSRALGAGSPRHGGVVMFEDVTQLRDTTQDHTGSNRIEPLSATRMAGYNNESTEFGVRELMVSATGVSELQVWRRLIQGFGVDIKTAAGLVYGSNGTAVEASTGAVTGTFSWIGYGRHVPDASKDRIFFFHDAVPWKHLYWCLSAFRLSDYVSLAQIALPYSQPREMVRWGSNGLAVVVDGKVLILTTTLLD
jgi:DNA-binding beta-propeller fold protein YncE